MAPLRNFQHRVKLWDFVRNSKYSQINLKKWPRKASNVRILPLAAASIKTDAANF